MRQCYELTIANIEIYEVMKTLALVYARIHLLINVSDHYN
jgi:hypothetical protein